MTKFWIATLSLVWALGPLACSETDDAETSPTMRPAAEETRPTEQASAEVAETTARARAAKAQRVNIEVTAQGYTPDTVEAKAGEPLTLVFKRTTEKGCGERLVFPGLDIERELPLNEAVTINLTPEEDQTIAFTCGMGMYEGSVVVDR
jgi:hypothetical protein